MSDGAPRPGDLVTANVRLTRPLGAGGMGAVWAAEHLGLETEVVVKFMLESLATSPEAAARFRREAASAARVRSPHVVRMHDFGVTREGAPFIVMERLRGRDLSQELAERGRLPFSELLSVVAPLCEALDAAHAVGIVHRDLKAANVFLADTPGGRVVKLLDFGVARWLEDATLDRGARRGALIGSPFAMSPEQLEGRSDVDAASDVWALGVLVFESLTGRRPFDATTLGALMLQVLSDPLPAPSRVNPALSSAMDAWFARACSRDRGQRFASAGEAARALAAASGATATRWALRRPTTAPSEMTWTPADPLAATQAAGVSSRALAPSSDFSEATTRTWVTVIEPARTRLPAELNAFVGRERELDWLEATFAAGARHVSLLGLGGAGKSRLATRFAWASSARWRGGSIRCDLGDAHDAPDDVARAAAVALEVPLGRAPIEQVGRALAAREDTLLILDSVEQVRQSVMTCVQSWLDLAPNVRFILTSRERIGLPSERTLALDPLDPRAAVALFMDRASAVRGAPSSDPDERDTIATLVELLDRLPLAIELAAARTNVLTPRRMLERVRERFKLLTASGRTGRQTTMRAVLDGSWELLHDGERAALAQLAIFHGGFTALAAERVLLIDDLWPLDAVQSLVDKSLVVSCGPQRFTMLATVHAYASERLAASGRAAQIEARHGAYFAELGRFEAIASLHTHGGRARRAELEQELDNLLAATERALARDDGPTAALAALAAWEVFESRGPFEAARALLARVRAKIGTQGVVAACVLRALGHAIDWLGDTPGAIAVYEEAIRVLREEGATGPLVDALQRSTVAVLTTHGADAALKRLAEALSLTHAHGDRVGLCKVLLQRGQVELNSGRMVEAMETLCEAIAVAREVGHRSVECAALTARGVTVWLKDRRPEVLEDFQRALVLADEEGFKRARASLLVNIGEVERDLGRPERARRALEAALALTRAIGDGRNAAIALAELAALEHGEGRREEALLRWGEAEQLLRSMAFMHQLCLLFAARAKCEAHHDRSRSEHDLREAERIAAELTVEPESEAWQRIGMAREALAR
jgi:serine/threonine protein kinase/predicted ATPase